MTKKSKKTEKKPTKEDLFVHEYLTNGRNQSKAYMEVYESDNPLAASVQGHHLLKKPNIKEAIRKITKEKLDQYDYCEGDIIREVAGIAFSDITNYLDFAGDEILLKSSDTLKHYSRVIKKVKITPKLMSAVGSDGEKVFKEGATVELELYDKIKALDMLGKNLQLFEPKKKDEDAGSINDKLADIARAIEKSDTNTA